MTLNELQVRMFALITGDSAADESLPPQLIPGGALSANDRVNIYAEMYWLRMRDTLRADFKYSHALLGDEAFDVQVARYIRVTPSTHFSLGNLGHAFANSLRAHAGDARADLADLAAYEWARGQAFIAPDSPILSAADFAERVQQDFASVVLVPSLSLRVLELNHDVSGLWAALEAEVSPAPNPVSAPTHLVLWRKQFTVFHAKISEPEFQALTRAIAGSPLPEICECFSESETPAQAAFEAIGSWVSEGMMAGLGRVEAE